MMMAFIRMKTITMMMMMMMMMMMLTKMITVLMILLMVTFTSLVALLASYMQKVSRRWICLDNCTCCHA